MSIHQETQNNNNLCVSILLYQWIEQQSNIIISVKPKSKHNMSNPQSIFYSDEEEDEFQIEKKQMNPKENDLQKYIDDILSPIKMEKKDFQESAQRHLHSLKREIDTSNQESSKDLADFSDQEESDSNDSSEFSLNKNVKDGKIPKVGKKVRVSNQNICKKYHTLANKCLRQIQIYKYLSPYIRHVHKRNYFIYVLIACQKTGKLDQFAKIYRESAGAKLSKCQQAMKDSFHGSKKYKENKQFLEALRESLEALSIFEKGQVYEALMILFDVAKMKRISWLQIAHEEVKNFGENFPIKRD